MLHSKLGNILSSSMEYKWSFIQNQSGKVEGARIIFPGGESMARTLRPIVCEVKELQFEVKIIKEFVDLEDSGIEEDETHFRIGSALDSWLTESKTYFEQNVDYMI